MPILRSACYSLRFVAAVRLSKVTAFLVVSLLCAAVSQANDFNHADELSYYRALVPVENQTAVQRKLAAQQGLQEVLVRMAGSQAVLAHDGIQTAITNALAILLQYQYSVLDDELLKEAGFTQYLSVVFSPRDIKALLRNTAQPFWPTNRPKTLIWIVEDDATQGRRFLSSDLNHPFVNQLKRAVYKSGVPILFPLYDFDDLSQFPVDAAWELDEQTAIEASKRYGVDAILLARLSQTSRGDVLASWQVFHNGRRELYDLKQDGFPSTADVVVSNLAQWYSDIYAVVSRGVDSSRVFIEIDRVQTFKHYMQSTNFLRGLAITKDVSLVSFANGAMLLAVQSDAGIDQLMTTLQLDKRIELVSKGTRVMPSLFSNSGGATAGITETGGESLGLPALSNAAQGSKNNPLKYRWAGD